MRFVLALLAVMALVVNPVTAAAAQVACVHDMQASIAGMDSSAMSGMAHANGHKTTANPCCDPGSQHKMSDKSCAQACAASCVVIAALPTSQVSIRLIYTRAAVPPLRQVSAKGYKPAGPERPPKSIA
jgi:uncharacterized protein involved in copper resistance